MTTEEELIAKLKTLCNAKPDDEDEKQQEAACNKKACGELFANLGNMYMENCDTEDIQLRLIRSAALLAAASIRNPTEKVASDLKKLWCVIQQKAKAKHPDNCLNKVSDQIKLKVAAMRKETRQTLSVLPKLNFFMTKQEILLQQKNKIKIVEDLQNKISSLYTELMKMIAIKCRDILGEKPCQFALIGMGSLARKEITPYSDFECAILLEEGLQNQQNYKSVLNYFRWFAVIFQVIIISLGETILPSVAIPGLNNFCKTGDNWFYDSITPRGISFDGFMPHACKTPLGRQEFTDQKPWKTELIKPVSEMLKYLTVEEDLKNGYQIADILFQSCFVFGEKTLYKNFFKGVISELDIQQNLPEYQHRFWAQLEKDYEKFDSVQALVKLAFLNTGNVKREFYRNPTIFISAAAKLLKYECSSCFKIISQMNKDEFISSDLEHKLKYAVAISCELRLKVYDKNEKQADSVKLLFAPDHETIPLLYDLIGKKCLVDFFSIVLSLDYNFSFPLLQAENIICFHQNADETIVKQKCMVLICLEEYEQCHSLLTSYANQVKEERYNTNEDVLAIRGLILFLQYSEEKSRARELFVEYAFSYFGENYRNLQNQEQHQQFAETERKHFFKVYENVYTIYCTFIDWIKDLWYETIRESGLFPQSEKSLNFDPNSESVVDDIVAHCIKQEKEDGIYEESRLFLLFQRLKHILFGIINFLRALQDLQRDMKLRWPNLYDRRKHAMLTRKRKAEEHD